MAQRLCDSCNQIDEDPRHVYGLAGDENESSTYTEAQMRAAVEAAGGDADKLVAVMSHLGDRATAMKHFDCCLADGCPDGTCDAKLADDNDPFDGGKTTGKKLIAAYVKQLEGKN